MNSISSFTSSTSRLTGLSGFDTESMVTELMNAERIPLDALKQKRQIVEWKQQAYRDVSSSLVGFKSKFFDIVNRSSYMLSENSIKPMSVTSSNSSYITATASSGARAGTQTMKVLQLATADTSVSSGNISNDISGIVTDKALSGKKISVTLDGITKEINLENYTDDDLATKLQASLDDAFGANKLSVSFNTTSQSLSIGTINGSTEVSVGSPSTGTSGLGELGLTAGESNRLSMRSTLDSFGDSLNTKFNFNGGDTLKFTINGKTFTAKSTDTLDQVFEKINNDTDANVTISYDEINDKVTLVSNQTGAGNNLTLSESGTNFLAALNLGTITEGVDAKVSMNGGDTLVRGTNNFTLNGMTYTLNKVHDAASDGETMTVSHNTDSVISNVKTFIEEYNKLIDSLNSKTSESYDRDYTPLTDAQKEDMTDAEIENWEGKAKTGLLRNDSIINKITLSMRQALYEKVEGVGLTLKDIGIESKSYSDKGKLYLDEDKLKNALLNNSDEVTKLLNGVSSDNPSYTRTLTSEQKADRYSKSGVFQRLSDIINDNVSTSRDSSGNKGILLEKAGIEGDLSNTKNLIYEELERYDDRIDTLIDKLTKKEENYYQKFANLETMLAKMNQQSEWITSQFSAS